MITESITSPLILTTCRVAKMTPPAVLSAANPKPLHSVAQGLQAPKTTGEEGVQGPPPTRRCHQSPMLFHGWRISGKHLQQVAGTL